MRNFILFSLITSSVWAQMEDPLKYFPSKTGNMWEYYFDDLEYPDTVQVFNIKDSVDAEGNIYVTQAARRINPIKSPLLFPDTTTYMIDTSFNVYELPLTETSLLYKLNAEEGEQWVIRDYSNIGGDGYEIARLRDVWEDGIFYGSDITTSIKSFLYYYSTDSTDTLGLVRYGSDLAYGFGVWSKGGGDAIGNVVLKGCVINGILYGDTTGQITSIRELSESFPIQFKLYQNYPNPFNPVTTIKYQLPKSGLVQLKAYDILGKEIAVLVNEMKSEGTYFVNFEAADLTSGVYIYSLQVNDFIQNNKMLLLK